MKRILEVTFYAVTVLGMLFGSIVWAYGTFELKDSAKDWKDLILGRLDRIESKIDTVKQAVQKGDSQ